MSSFFVFINEYPAGRLEEIDKSLHRNIFFRIASPAQKKYY